jgi:hypothetical protein
VLVVASRFPKSIMLHSLRNFPKCTYYIIWYKEVAVAYLRQYSSMFQKYLRKTTSHLSQDGGSPGPDLNTAISDYEP